MAFEQRIDSQRLKHALDAADFMASVFIPSGRYNVKETWGPEGILYLAESSYALLDAFRLTKKQNYLIAVKCILNELKRIQNADGGIAIDLGRDGLKFYVTDEQRKDSSETPDLPTTAALLRTVSEYEEVTGDTSFNNIGEKAFAYLLERWDPEYGSFRENKDRQLMSLRSNPNSYHIFFFINLFAWKKYKPEKITRMIDSLLNFVKGTFESYDKNTMPLVYGLHAATLMDHCNIEYIRDVIKPKLDNDMVNNTIFLTPGISGGYGHRDGLRGIVTTESHMRSVAGILLAMKKYDLVTGTDTYRNSQKYQESAKWVDSMKGDGFYYEFEQLPEHTKHGMGSPGQYLPCWWIFGKM